MGKTNVKCHVFLSAILARINAMENGEDVESAIFKAAKESAETCYDLLRHRLASTPSDFGRQQAVDMQSDLRTEVEQDFGIEVLVSVGLPSLQTSNNRLPRADLVTYRCKTRLCNSMFLIRGSFQAGMRMIRGYNGSGKNEIVMNLYYQE